jgi:diguanylate cyclase (GGDEF)-like protein
MRHGAGPGRFANMDGSISFAHYARWPDRSTLSVLLLFFVTFALSVIMLMVLRSLARSGVAGVRAWSAANALALIALPLFAARGHVPAWLSVDLANLLLLGAPVLMYAGFARYLDRRVPVAALLVLVGVQTLAIAVFHYVVDAVAVRIALTSLFHGIVCAAIVWRLKGAPGRGYPASAAPAPTPYSARFAFWSALVLTAGYGLRCLIYAAHYDAPLTIFDDSALNLAFVALGTLALPGLTLGAVMMANAGLIGQATHAAEHDYLTGAWSRRAFFGQAAHAHAHAVRAAGALAVLVFDVDHFKAINDTHGHAVGDLVLADIVARSATVMRGEPCARLGGEEFAVLLPGTDADAAVRVAEALRLALQAACVLVPGGASVCYTVSVGVAGLAPGETLAGLLHRADQALYAAKRGGRNRVWDARVQERSALTG